MGGGKKEPDVTQIPLMSQPQSQLLNQLLSFIPQAMGGVQLGQAYGGPSESSYSPFTIPEGGGGGGGKGGPPTGGRRDRDIGPEGPRRRVDDDGGRRGGRERVRGRDRGRDRTRIPEAVLDEILNSEIIPTQPPGGGGYRAIRPGEDPATYQREMAAGGTFISRPHQTNIPEVRIPESQPISPIQQTLTEPIIAPFREGMTGNFPRRRGGGR